MSSSIPGPLSDSVCGPLSGPVACAGRIAARGRRSRGGALPPHPKVSPAPGGRTPAYDSRMEPSGTAVRPPGSWSGRHSEGTAGPPGAGGAGRVTVAVETGVAGETSDGDGAGDRDVPSAGVLTGVRGGEVTGVPSPSPPPRISSAAADTPAPAVAATSSAATSTLRVE